MQAFLNDPAIKVKYRNRVFAHQEADQIVQKTYWGDDRGCAVGCTVHQSVHPHEAYESELGIPVSIAWLEDGVFENLPLKEAKAWPLQFLTAINVGSDLTLIPYRFSAWLLAEETGILPSRYLVAPAIDAVRALCVRTIDGDAPSLAEWCQAEAAVTVTDVGIRLPGASAKTELYSPLWSLWAAKAVCALKTETAVKAKKAVVLALTVATSVYKGDKKDEAYRQAAAKLLELLQATS